MFITERYHYSKCPWFLLCCTVPDITAFNKELKIWFVWQHIQYVIPVDPKPCTVTHFLILHTYYQYCFSVSCNFCHQFLNPASLSNINSQLYVFCDKKFINLRTTKQYGFDDPGYVYTIYKYVHKTTLYVLQKLEQTSG